MYSPPQFTESRADELRRIVDGHPLGMLVTHGASGLDADHIPFLLDAAADGSFTLHAHVARANPVWRDTPDGAAVMVMFRGAHGYISPNWYPSKHETHRKVPTWNYEVVHAHGTMHVRDDAAFVRGVVARLTRVHEAAQPHPWKMGDAPADYLDEQLRHIVGIEVRVTRLEGKRKLNQHQAMPDREGAVRGLESQGNAALAQAMRATFDPPA